MPTIHVRLFAGLYQTVGKRQIDLVVPDGGTIADLHESLGAAHPLVKPILPAIVAAVAEEYVGIDYVLHEGDEVALIPPVSGGA
jgi:molybdopterin converting factor small subunit